MNSRRFDAFTRSLARTLPRRGVLRTAAAVAASASASALGAAALAAQEANPSGNVGLPCVKCNCSGDDCDCCLIGITGGGVLRTSTGDVNLVLFATQLADDAPQQAAGFVRWMDPNAEGGLVLESVGPVAYEWTEGEEHLRHVSGTMSINGGDQQPFEMQVVDAGPGKAAEDSASLRVGGSGGAGFIYEAAGTMVGGDLQLLSDVAPITPA
ncbi:MAG: hypothetical protein U0Z70_04705 [Thermomicrobiales bacterium]|nr:hypothetical protein [Chloroflexia bacterium]